MEEAEKALQQASDRKLEIPDLAGQRYDLAFLKGDKAGMDREAALAQGNPQRTTWSLIARLLSWHIPVICKQARLTAQRAADLNSAAGPAGTKRL